MYSRDAKNCRHRTRYFPVMTAMALLLAAPMAQARPDPAPRSRIVRTADLDLTSQAGRKQLDRRIRQAAREVCAPVTAEMLRNPYFTIECRRTAQLGTRRQVAVLVGRARWAGTGPMPSLPIGRTPIAS